VGEAFPLEIRAMGIALLFAFGTAIGGLAIPLLFDWLVPAGASNIRYYSFILFAAMLMTAAGWVAWYLGFPAARRTSEDANRTLGEPNESKDSATGVN
jgi:hypothetical protein